MSYTWSILYNLFYINATKNRTIMSICTFNEVRPTFRTMNTKKLKDVNSFFNLINIITEMVTYFKDKNNKSKKRYKIYKTPNTLLKSIDTIRATSVSKTLSITGIGLTTLTMSAGLGIIR